MKKLYMLLAGIAFAGFQFSDAQVLVDTDFSELRSQVELGHQDQRNPEDALPINGGTMHWRGPRYNDLSNTPSIGEVGGGTVAQGNGDAVPLDPNDEAVNYMRIGTNPTLTDGVPTNHFYAITPTNPFVNGGKITMIVSVHGTGQGINIYNATDATLLGTINISGLTTYKYEEITFDLPSDFNGVKTLSFTRATVNGAITGGTTFFTWSVKIETGDIPNSINNPTFNANVSKVEYYNISGVNMGGDWNLLPAGIYIVKTTYDNGAVTTEKISKTRR